VPQLPQLTDLQLDFELDNYLPPITDAHYAAIDPSFGKLLKRLKMLGSNTGEPTVLKLKSLMLPNVKQGYSQNFLFPLLRSMIPS
jgi:hypothetical protein